MFESRSYVASLSSMEETTGWNLTPRHLFNLSCSFTQQQGEQQLSFSKKKENFHYLI